MSVRISIKPVVYGQRLDLYNTYARNIQPNYSHVISHILRDIACKLAFPHRQVYHNENFLKEYVRVGTYYSTTWFMLVTECRPTRFQRRNLLFPLFSWRWSIIGYYVSVMREARSRIHNIYLLIGHAQWGRKHGELQWEWYIHVGACLCMLAFGAWTSLGNCIPRATKRKTTASW